MKIMHISDLHLCPLGHIPSSRTECFHQDVADEFNALFTKAEKEQANFIVVTGDLFHIKAPTAYSSRDLNYYTALFKSCKVPVLCIAGNHDLPKANYSLIEDSPYRNLMNSLSYDGGWCDLSLKIKSASADGISPPLLNQVIFVGIPYTCNREYLKTYSDLMLKKLTVSGYMEISSDNRFICLLTHVDAFPDAKSASFFKGMTFEELAELFPYANMIMNGHIHCSFAPFVTSQGIIISKPWSMGRVVKDYFNQENDLIKHVPNYSFIEINPVEGQWGVNVEYKEIPHKPFSQVFIPDLLKKDLEKNQKVLNFVESLKSGVFDKNSGYFNLSDPETFMNSLNLSTEIQDIIREYLTRGED